MKAPSNMPAEMPDERFDVGLPAAHQSRPAAFPEGIVRPSAFETPDRLTDIVNWHGHIPFAFWVIEALRPRVLVELGTHKGDSYCAFAQAVDRLGLATLCYAIDTWRGDEHAGFYGEGVFEELRQYHDSRYGRFSRLVRSTFDDAVSRFGDQSIDLLHIDGLHTYEAVKHDFETWQPKLSNRGVVLFHDINVRESDFGVSRLWDELIREFPSFMFHHSHGLGVLLVGTEIPETLKFLAEYDPAEAAQVRVLFSRLGDTLLQRSGMMLERAKFASELSEKDRWHADIAAALQKKYENLFRELEVVREQKHELAARNSKLERELRVVTESYAWNLSAPYRSLLESARKYRLARAYESAAVWILRKFTRPRPFSPEPKSPLLPALQPTETSIRPASSQSIHKFALFVSGSPGDTKRYRCEHQAEQ